MYNPFIPSSFTILLKQSAEFLYFKLASWFDVCNCILVFTIKIGDVIVATDKPNYGKLIDCNLTFFFSNFNILPAVTADTK